MRIKNNSRSSHISAIEYDFLYDYLYERDQKKLDLSALVDDTFESMDLAFCTMGSIEVNCSDVVTPFTVDIYFSNTGHKSGTSQGTISIAAGTTSNIIQISQIPSKFLILEINGAADGFIDNIVLMGKR